MAKITKREKVLAAIKVAGFSNDQKAFLRLYAENRVDFAAAKAAYADGLRIGARWNAWT